MQIGDKVELIKIVKGSPIGTQGIVHLINDSEIVIQLYPLEHDVLLHVLLSDIKKV